MQLSVATATALIAAATSVSAASIRSYLPYSCSGDYIVGTLKLRSPDNSTQVVAFLNDYTDEQGRPKLITQLNGTPVPQDRQFAFEVCESQFLRRRDSGMAARDEDGYSTGGFVLPNNHRNKALTKGNLTEGEGDLDNGYRASIVSDVRTDSDQDEDILTQWFDLYNNGTFYSLSHSELAAGVPVEFAAGPKAVSYDDGQTIAVEFEYVPTVYNYRAQIAPHGYALELHP